MPNYGYAATVSYVIVFVATLRSCSSGSRAGNAQGASHDRALLPPRDRLRLLSADVAFLSVFPFLLDDRRRDQSRPIIVKARPTSATRFRQCHGLFQSQVDAPRVFWNSAEIAILATLLTLAVSSLAGYGFEIFRSRMRERRLRAILLTALIPFAAMMVPLFADDARFAPDQHHIAVILPTIGSAFIIFYFRQARRPSPANFAMRRASMGSRNGRSSCSSMCR